MRRNMGQSSCARWQAGDGDTGFRSLEDCLSRHNCQALSTICSRKISQHEYVEEGLPKTQVLLWVSGEQLRAVFENVLLAEYHCRYDWRDRRVKDIHEGVFYPTRFASPQGTLIPLTSQDRWVVSRPQSRRGRVPERSPMQQVLLFVVVPTEPADG
jgi:hypothetical protein